MDKRTFRHTESIIYNYYSLKQEIEDIREGYIEAGMGNGEAYSSMGNGNNSRTEKQAAKLVDNERMKECQRQVRAIEKAHRAVPDEVKEVVYIKYGIRPGQDWEPPDKPYVSERTFYRHRKDFVGLVAQLLGWRREGGE